MLLDGVSIKGSYHYENQDSFRCTMLDCGFVVALSDGLGSRTDSKTGSEAACTSIVEMAEELGSRLVEINPKEFARLVHARWLEKLDGRDTTQCYATMLFFVLYQGRAFAARLGDGFIGLWLDDSLDILFDAKEDRFINETDCLSEELAVESISVFEKDVMEVHGGVLCSDGIEFEPMNCEELIRFTEAFIKGNQGMRHEDITTNTADWLRNWAGHDDKTIAFFITGEEEVDEKSI
ncbi:protein phosphatase 2C domain-containing protein [Succinimonas sp.]|uniref:protein phosphatase 2C domain-containing protein n=1 Tax=Succinimonas sp. TaxID=1936151 RepID=UPI003870BF3A